MKPAGQPEQASLNQCQRIAQNLCSSHAELMLAIGFLCNINDTRALISPCSHADARSVNHGVSPALHYSAYGNWSLATYPFFSSSEHIRSSKHRPVPELELLELARVCKFYCVSSCCKTCLTRLEAVWRRIEQSVYSLQLLGSGQQQTLETQ